MNPNKGEAFIMADPVQFTDARGKLRWRCFVKAHVFIRRDKNKIVNEWQIVKTPITSLDEDECKRKALDYCEAVKTQQANTRPADAKTMTVGRMLQKYYAVECLEPENKEEATLINIRTSINAINAALDENTLLSALTDDDIREKVRGDRVQDQRNLSLLRKALSWAVYPNKWIENNPALVVRNRSLKAIPKVQAERSAIPKADLKKFFAYIADDIALLTLYYLLTFRGLRIGEALALRWSKIDWNERTMIVDETVRRQAVKKHGHTKKPKTDAGTRIVTLGPTALALLRWLKDDQEATERARAWHNPKRDHDLVFPSKEGVPFNPRNYRNRDECPLFLAAKFGPTYTTYSKKTKTKIVKPVWSAHWFRHTCATWMRNLVGDHGQHMPETMLADEIGHERDAWGKEGGSKSSKRYVGNSVEPRKLWIAKMEEQIDPLLPQRVRDRLTVVPLRRAG